jgi:hypothetical protein
MGLRRHCRIGVGLPADLVVFRGRRYSELLSRPQYDRVRDVYCISQPLLLLLLLLLTVTWLSGSGNHLLTSAHTSGGGVVTQHIDAPSCLPPACAGEQVVVRNGVPLLGGLPAYEELDYVPRPIKSGEGA